MSSDDFIIFYVEFFSTVLKKNTRQVKEEMWLARIYNTDVVCQEQLHKELVRHEIQLI